MDAPPVEQVIQRASNYRIARAYLAHLAPFNHPTMSARWEVHAGRVYVVYSYQTPVAWVWSDRTEFTDQRYSTTTSKHMGYIKSSLPEGGWNH